jgi:hypothetical protein
MSGSFDFKRSPEDEATFRKWRRGLVMLYGGIGFFVMVAVVAVHFAAIAMHVASR